MGPGMWLELTSLMSLPSTWNPEGQTQRIMDPLEQWPSTFLAPKAGFWWKITFSTDGGGREGWFRESSGALHLLCTLFPLLLRQVPLRSSGIRSGRWGTPALELPPLAVGSRVCCLGVEWQGSLEASSPGESDQV